MPIASGTIAIYRFANLQQLELIAGLLIAFFVGFAYGGRENFSLASEIHQRPAP